MTMERWFLFDDGPATGARNMAVDEFLLGRAERERIAPALRLYSFDPAAITIGYHQGLAHGLDRERIDRDGVDIVKRFTGGRALLHDGELTYCIVARTDRSPFDTHLQASYLRISEALVHALRSIGVDARISGGRPRHGSRPFSKPCLDSVSRHEITAGGRKIVASAQRRSMCSFLQHGSILLTPASERIVDYLPGRGVSLSGRVTSICGELGGEVEPTLVRRAVVRGFEEVFRVSFEELGLSEEEEREVLRREAAIRGESNGPRPREVAV
jgi:lipoate-protein ligase A